LIAVLYSGGADEWSVAIGTFDGQKVLAVRWNGNEHNPLGSPQARGNATWLVVDPAFNDAILSVVPEPQRQLANTLLAQR
jgi:hypothetical protein